MEGIFVCWVENGLIHDANGVVVSRGPLGVRQAWARAFDLDAIF